jgi:hypothetical protein
MIGTGLPQRPFVQLPAPPDGLGEVRREASRRRRRRALGVAVAGGGAVALAAVLAVGSGGSGLAVLQPVDPGVTPAPDVSAPASAHQRAPHSMTSAGHRHAATGESRTGRQPSAGAVGSRGGAGADGSGATTSRSRPRHQRAVATYSPAIRLVRSSSRSSQPRVCQGSTYSDDGRLGYAVDWCLTSAATPVAGGVELSLEICRDATSNGRLTFDSTREVDLTVKQGSTTIWDWARAHPGSPDNHQLSAPANGCWDWSLVWPGVTQSGRAAGHGSFTLVARSTAQELSGMPIDSVSFSY